MNSINPGATATEGASAAGVIGVGSDFEKQLLAMTPLGRIGQPSDIGRIAVFLASDEANWLTGEIILGLRRSALGRHSQEQLQTIRESGDDLEQGRI